VLIAATGIGKDNVEKTLTKILEQYRPAFIINIGLAGTLTHTLKRFSCLDISYVCTPTASRYAVPLCSYHSQASLVTVSKPVENESTARQLNESTGAELVDMEAAHIVEKATAHALPCRIIKIVSDYADRETRADFAHTLVHAHDAFFTACSLAHNTVSHDRK
jgi:nucleoside phosphorylase